MTEARTPLRIRVPTSSAVRPYLESSRNEARWRPSTRRESPGALGFFLGSVAIFAALICYMAIDSRPAIAFAIITIAAPGAIAVQRFRRYGLLDVLGLFCFVFVSYNGPILLRLSTMADLTAVLYPSVFSQETLRSAGMLDAIAAVTIFVTAGAVTRIFPSGQSFLADQSNGVLHAWFRAGEVMYLVGVTMYFLQWQQVGGYMEGLRAGRGYRFDMFGTTGLSWPYSGFLLPGLAAIWYASEQGQVLARRRIAWAALILWCALLLPHGDRLSVIEAVLTVVAVSFTCRARKLAVTVRLAALLLVAYGAFAIFGQVRSLIAPLSSGNINNRDAQAYVQGNWTLDWLLPERSELAGPYLSLLTVASAPSGYLLEGRNSYIDSTFVVLPQFLYPGTKPSQLAVRFAVSVSAGRGHASGWGFNPVAEAYLNFGIGGIVVIFVLWTLLFYGVNTVKCFSAAGVLMFSVLLPQTIDVNRMDFRNVYPSMTYLTCGVLLSALLCKGLAKKS